MLFVKYYGFSLVGSLYKLIIFDNFFSDRKSVFVSLCQRASDKPNLQLKFPTVVFIVEL